MGRQLRLELRRPPTYRREDFISSPTNADAIRVIDAWPAWPGGALALIGPEGSGKTHLAQAWAERVGAARFDASSGELDLPTLQGQPVLIEDADSWIGDDTLFHLINMAGAPGGGLLLTSRTPLPQWRADLPDLRSRLNALVMTELGEPDDAILAAVLGKFFRERNIRPTDDVLPYLMRRIERSVPRALAVVTQLDEMADAEHRPISRALARQILEIDEDSADLGE